VGKHPAGNVGVQIHHTRPISKGDVVWTIDPQGLATIGHFFKTGRVDMTRVVAVAGSEVAAPQYYKVIGGANIESLLPKSAFAPQTENHDVRIINGNPLTGLKVKNNGYLNFYTNCVTVIPEGNDFEFMGWIAPRPNKFSVSHSYFSWLMPKKRYNLNTNLNGGVRAYVVTGLYDKYLPMDIYPLYLLKACIAGDIDKMENLGIYEVIEEDFALCEFVDPSKTEMQEIIRQGINLMIKEN
jgi:Na+-transporting NADH:ubiquinone oxidoreductase subunit A